MVNVCPERAFSSSVRMLHGEAVAFCGRCGKVLANLQGKGSAGPFSMSHYMEGLRKTLCSKSVPGSHESYHC